LASHTPSQNEEQKNFTKSYSYALRDPVLPAR
jgi:hypothetical protein